jgi:hypothetical protein
MSSKQSASKRPRSSSNTDLSLVNLIDFNIDTICIGEFVIGIGTVVSCEDDKNTTHLLCVSRFATSPTGKLFLFGTFYEENENFLSVLPSETPIHPMIVKSILIIVDLSSKIETRIYPSFIRFAKTLPTLPYISLSSLYSYEMELWNFADQFYSVLQNFLKTRHFVEKKIFDFSSRLVHVKYFEFQDNHKKQTLLLHGDFSLFEQLFGKYYFHSQSNFSMSGWGFLHEEVCNHYIVSVRIVCLSNILSVYAHQLLQNPKSGAFQTSVV